MTSTYTHANQNNVIEISLIQNDFNVWLDKGTSLIPWTTIIQKKPESAVSTNEIKSDFDENQVLFIKKYSNKWIRIKGIVSNVKIENNEIFINLNSKYYTFRAYTELGDYASELKKNDSVDLYCFNTIPQRTFLVPFSASKCIPYGSYMLGANAKEYFDKVQRSAEYIKVKTLSSILYEVISKDELKQNCTSIKNNEKCITLFKSYIEELSKNCKSNKSEKCIKIKNILSKE